MRSKISALLAAVLLLMTFTMAMTALASGGDDVSSAVYGGRSACTETARLGDKSCLPSDVTGMNPEEAAAVLGVIGSGLMMTNAGAHFRPDEYVTIGELTTVLVRLLGFPTPDEDGDISKSAIEKGIELGLITKDTDVTKHAPRIDAAILFAKALGLKPTSDSFPAEDAAHLTPEQRLYLSAMYKAKLVIGTSDTTFTPDRIISRMELALIISRVLKTYL